MREAGRTLIGIGALLLALRAAPVGAGGNLEFRNPDDPATVISTRWDARRLPLRWVLSSDGLPGSDIDVATLEGEIQAAFDTWEALPTSNAAFTYGGQVDARNAQQDGAFALGVDGRNLVTFTDPDLVFPAGVLALNLTTVFTGDTVVTAANADLDGDGTPDLPEGTYAAGTVFDSDIAFNSSVDWAVSGQAGSNDVRAVALHEIGHLLGLCHSAIRHAVMWPFLPADVASARVPTADDVAWVSAFYPKEPEASAAFGRIAGKVTNGINGFPILGAHVYAVDPTTQESVVGGYTGDDGAYLLPGLAPGDWLVAVEPLDGDPPGTEPFRVNHVVAGTLDTSFPEEFYDADEGAVEADATAATAVPVTAGTTANDIDVITNTLTLPGASVTLPAGFSLFAWPVAVPVGTSAFDLLAALGGPEEVASVDRFDPQSGSFERAEHVDGAAVGADFPLRRGEGYAVHMVNARIASFTGATDCPTLDLARGLNLIGVPCRPPGYTAFALLEDLGTALEVDRVARFDPDTQAYEVARYDAEGAPQGDDFPITSGEGYQVLMRAPKAGIRLPRPSREVTPHIAGLSPGRGVPGTVVAILGEGFDPDPAKNVVTFNGVRAATVVATTTAVTAVVPGAATSGPVRLVVDGHASNEVAFVVEPAVVHPDPGEPTTDLVPGQTAEAALSSDGEQDRYTFTALAGSVVTVTATSLAPGAPDLLLVLEDPFGAVAAADDNSGGGTDPRINNFVLTATGTHTVVVTNVPGSGTGGYRVSLAVATRPAETQLSIISGDVQTGEPGTELSDPLAVFATGPTGAALAGIPVSVVATEVDVSGQRLAGAIEADTIVLATNASGIITIKTTLPNKSGLFEITVVIPGAKTPVTFRVMAAAGRVARITTFGNDQHGTVNAPLPLPLEVLLETVTGTPVAGAGVEFKVVAGGGTITPGGAQLSNAAGRVTATWKLGKLVSAPQIVAATVPGRTRPILFEATPEASTPQQVVADKSSFNRITLGTSIMNAIFVRVLDGFGNPVRNAIINYSAPPGIVIDPGVAPDGTRYPDFQTDQTGLHVAAVGLPLKVLPGPTCSALSSDLAPSINEFGQQRRAPYAIVASVAGTSLTHSYPLHVDMGPRVVSEDGGATGSLGTISQARFGLHRVERFDRNGDNDFRPDPFDCFTSVDVPNVAVHVSGHRIDGRDETTVGLRRTGVLQNDRPTAANGIATFDMVFSDVPGLSSVIGNVPKVRITFVRAQNSTADFSDPHLLSSAFLALSQGPRVTAEVTDHGSGVDLATLVIRLNGAAIFNGAAPPGKLPVFPDRLEVRVGGREVTAMGAELVTNGAFDRVRFDYFPSLPKLQANNSVQIPVFADRAGNPASAPVTSSFTWP